MSLLACLLATISTQLSGPLTDLTSYFGDVQTLILTVVVFFLGLAFLAMVKRRR